jgi:hypothetical protein
MFGPCRTRHGKKAAGTLIAAALGLSIALSAGGCHRAQAVVFVADGGDLTRAQTENLARTASLSPVAGVKPADAAAARQRALQELRRHGTPGDAAANVLTVGFPQDVKSVPVLVEAALVDRVPSWVIVEAWSGDGKTLSSRRLWIFDRRTGQVLASSSFR